MHTLNAFHQLKFKFLFTIAPICFALSTSIATSGSDMAILNVQESIILQPESDDKTNMDENQYSKIQNKNSRYERYLQDSNSTHNTRQSGLENNLNRIFHRFQHELLSEIKTLLHNSKPKNKKSQKDNKIHTGYGFIHENDLYIPKILVGKDRPGGLETLVPGKKSLPIQILVSGNKFNEFSLNAYIFNLNTKKTYLIKKLRPMTLNGLKKIAFPWKGTYIQQNHNSSKKKYRRIPKGPYALFVILKTKEGVPAARFWGKTFANYFFVAK